MVDTLDVNESGSDKLDAELLFGQAGAVRFVAVGPASALPVSCR